MVKLIILIKNAYKDRISEIENKLFNTEHNSKNVNFYKEYIKKLKEILLGHDTSDIKENKKSSGKGLNISYLPILLSEININSSKN